MSWTDEEIDKLFQDRANNQSFDYKNDYWKEMEGSLDNSGEVIQDPELDSLFVQSSKGLSFNYKSEYWLEMLALLPRRRGADFIWYFMSSIFVGLLMMTAFTSSPLTESTDQTLSSKIIENIDEGLENDSQKASFQEESTITENLEDVINDQETNAITSDYSNSTVDGNRIVPTSIATNNNASIVSNANGIDEPKIERNESSFIDAGNGMSLDEGASISDGSIDQLPYLETVTFAYDFSHDQEVIDIGYDLKQRMTSRLYLELNGGLSQSLISPSNKLSYSGGVGAGLQLQKGRISMGVGLNANLSKHNDLVLSRKAKVYGFGSEVYRYEINYNEIYAIEGNISLGYKFGRHQFSVGVRPSYIFNSKVGYSMVTENPESSDRKTYYGYTDGVRSWGIKPMVGYAFDITPKWTFGLNVGTQILPAVNEEYINGVNNQFPIDGQLYLRRLIRLRR